MTAEEEIAGLSPRSLAVFICLAAKAYAKALGFPHPEVIMENFANEVFEIMGECRDPAAHAGLEHLCKMLMEGEPYR
jgi:hypothetical protein